MLIIHECSKGIFTFPGIFNRLLSEFKLLTIEPLIVEHICHLPINPRQLRKVAVDSRGVGTVDGIVVALEGHGGLAVLVVGTAEEVVGQQAVVGSTMAVEEADVGLYLPDGEGLAGAVALVDAVKAGTHAGAVGFRSAAA